MNTPTPDFMSKIASSSQTISSIEEHDAVKSAVNIHPVSATHGVALGSPSNSASVSTVSDLESRLVDTSSAFGPSSIVLGTEIVNLGFDTPSSSLPDFKGLASALEASSGNEFISSPREDPAVTDIGHALVTGEELGFVENLSHWMEERLGSSVVEQWGVAPGSKRVANLWGELAGGESSLEDSTPPKRITNVACVRIRNDGGDVLVEAYQEMSDGSKRERNRPLSEKMKPGEDVKEACLRGIFEELGPELGAKERVVLLPESYKKKVEERDSISYPGLPTCFFIHSMEAHIQHLPPTEFSTDEDESDFGGDNAINGDPGQLRAVRVNRHFWKWVPESELAELCNK